MADREGIAELRHDVFAHELGQHPPNRAGRLTDPLDEVNEYIVVCDGPELRGFVSLTPPAAGRYSVDKYVTRDDWPELRSDDLFEVRILTVREGHRGSGAALLLMYGALRWIAAQGGKHIVAIGRTEVLDLYRKVGLRPLGRTVRSGAVSFELMAGQVVDLERNVERNYDRVLRHLEARIDWALQTPVRAHPGPCLHGGASFETLGTRFDALHRRGEIVVADVLDAWFAPAPEVVAALTDDPAWLARTSPPTAAEGLVDEIAAVRGVPRDSVVVGAGSSDLVFRAFRGWLTAASRVLILDPTYGEYAHVLERVVGCHVDRLTLTEADGWCIDPERLRRHLASGYDLVVLVNPNNPTGVHIDAADLRALVDEAPRSTCIWIDEAYVDYVGPDQSLEQIAARSPNVVVCKSMSKAFALSGLRVAYLVASTRRAAEVRMWTPPWPVSLPAQIAAVRALRALDHYRRCWEETTAHRRALAESISARCPGVRVTQSVANFVLISLPPGGPTAAQITAFLRLHSVFVRDLTPVSEAFGGRTVRIAVRGPAENARIVDVLSVFVGTPDA